MTEEMFGGQHRSDEVHGTRARRGHQGKRAWKTTRRTAGIGQDGDKVVVSLDEGKTNSTFRLTGPASLEMCGCGLDTENLFPKGTNVRIGIAHGLSTFEALGRVAYAQPTLGMGIVFTNVEPESGRVLKGWLAELW